MGAGHAEAGREAEEHGSADGDDEGPEKRGGVDVDVVEQRQRERGLMLQPRRDGEGQRKAEERTDSGEQEAFGKQLANDAAAAGAERAAECELLAARGGTCEQQVGEIDADDEQDESDGGPEDDKRTMELAADVLLEWCGVGGVALAVFRMVGPEVEFGEEQLGFAARLLDGDAGLEAADQRDGIAIESSSLEIDGDEEIDSCAGREDGAEVEAAREYANDGEGAVVEINGLAEDGGIAMELPLPDGIAEQDDLACSRERFVFMEEAAHQRVHAEHLEEIRSDTDAGEGPGIAVAGELEVVAGGEGIVSGDVGVGLVALAELCIGVNGIGGGGPVAVEDLRTDPEQARGIAEGKRAQHERVDDAEDGDVGADAEREDEDGDEGEAAVAAQGAEGVAKILQEDVERGEAARGALLLARLLDAAEADEGQTAGFLGRKAAPEILFDGEVEVRGEFLLEVGVADGLVEEGTDAGEGGAETGDHSAPSGDCASTRPITSERRRQSAASRASCFRPLRVMA